MSITKDLIEKSEKVFNESKKLENSLVVNDEEKIFFDEKHTQTFFLRRLYQQGKQLSQIIAYIWRWIDADNAQNKKEAAIKLNEYFIKPNEDKLKKLLKSNPKDFNDISEEANLLRIVFFEDNSSNNNDLLFPIFDEFELGSYHQGLGYLLEVTYNSFQGVIEDPDRNNPDMMKFKIPFPPRPNNAMVTESELEQWIKDRTPNKYFSDSPFIPTTCS